MRNPGCLHVPDDRAELVIIEYQQLKEEQRQRITSRDHLVYAALATAGAVGGAALQAGARTILLLVPVVSVVLGWTYVSTDRKVTQIGRHIEHVLAPRLTPTTGTFTWEAAHRCRPGYRLHKRIQVIVSLLTFCGPAVAAVVANSDSAFSSLPILVLATVGLLATAVLAHQLASNTDAEPSQPRAPFE
ncbi:hypothetical protein Ais01nite_10010 [Asanoa ishikariensis]|uniref:Uncharacterized protein n=1 Tax=Asanoa ishikariensis TaxID=137265 RepID=A0A1H3T5R0_9ACTN|nr:hypothetical protein [Asanoa ishikariensis]GIF62966.1 hypothetical protein Ais01nite_10010 [Asanoa ishikariensis]SDZ45582.1 hypothetical protein SAMN05421684_5231 [Asanoa ishikariensis]